jgi:hypothetical protein
MEEALTFKTAIQQCESYGGALHYLLKESLDPWIQAAQLLNLAMRKQRE